MWTSALPALLGLLTGGWAGWHLAVWHAERPTPPPAPPPPATRPAVTVRPIPGMGLDTLTLERCALERAAAAQGLTRGWLEAAVAGRWPGATLRTLSLPQMQEVYAQLGDGADNEGRVGA